MIDPTGKWNSFIASKCSPLKLNYFICCCTPLSTLKVIHTQIGRKKGKKVMWGLGVEQKQLTKRSIKEWEFCIKFTFVFHNWVNYVRTPLPNFLFFFFLFPNYKVLHKEAWHVPFYCYLNMRLMLYFFFQKSYCCLLL